MNIKKITYNLLCSGCGTCNTVCSHNAIEIRKSTTMGLMYADIDESKCINCGLCLKMCPSNNILIEKSKITEDKIVGYTKACYVGRSLQCEFYKNAQSGGLVTSILFYLFKNELIDAAVSCRMEYGQTIPSVHYSILTSAEELIHNQRSCYTQVDIVSALSHISKFKSVAIVGLPCHIQGVSNLMSIKKYTNVTYRIGLVCDKTYSESYMDSIINGVNLSTSKVKIIFRKKDFTYNNTYYSYRHAPTVIMNDSGKMFIIPESKRMFMKQFFTVPKCRICWDKLNVQADIVLGDPWGLEGMFDEQKGDSLIIVRNDKAADLIEAMYTNGLIRIAKVPVQDVSRGQTIEKRTKQIQNLDWKDIVSCWKEYENTGKKEFIKRVQRLYHKKLLVSFIEGILKKIKIL